MKKIYMPSDETLLKMQSLGGNIYKYLLIKVIESLIIKKLNNSNEGILKNTYKYLRENPNIARGICLLYPEEIKYSEIAQYDAYLAEQLIKKSIDKEIYNLDKLIYFKKIINENTQVIKTTIDVLDRHLSKNPEYRFEYQSNNGTEGLLDSIFSTNIIDENIYWNQEMKEKLSRIEPAYAILLPTIGYQDDFLESTSRKELLRKGIAAYASRYGINNITSKEVDLDKPDEDTKRLIKCIKNNRNNLY